MNWFITTVLFVLVAVSAFLVGQATAPMRDLAPVTISPIIPRSTASEIKPVVPAQAPAPTQYDRELMSSLNAIQSAVQTGVNSSRYSELIATGRTKLADLKLYSPNSPIVAPANLYLDAHAMTLSIWTNKTGSDGRIYVPEKGSPDMFSFIRRVAPNATLDTYGEPLFILDSPGELWGYTESKLWPEIAAAWQKLNRAE